MNKSLTSILAMAKIRLTQTFNSIISEGELPAYMYESVLQEMLAEIHKQQLAELAAENSKLIAQISKGESNEKEN